jgi:hypothetical protein
MTEKRKVTNEDVTSFASKKCRMCFGTGWQRKWVYLDENHAERTTGFCGCATRRFNALAVDRHKVEQDKESGAFFWKEAGG